MGTLYVDKLDPESGTALEIGTSGDTITVPTGAGLTVTDEVKTNKISPATGTAFALGDSGDTFTIPSGATIANSGTATGFGGGKINQIVSAVQPATAVISVANDTTWYDIGLTASITPSASDSKVLIMASVCGSLESGNFSMSFQFVRDSTPINLGTASGSRTPVSWGTGVQSGGNYDVQNAGHMFLDSPATDSAIAYKVQLRSTRDGTDWYRNRAWYDTDASSTFLATSTITLFEVLA